MSIDIYHSRRTNYRECRYFVREEGTECGNLDKWILTEMPSGTFYAKEIAPQTENGNEINNVFIMDKKIITLETTDIVDDLKRGCIISYIGHGWFVEQVQRQTIIKETAFGEMKYKTVISIRR